MPAPLKRYDGLYQGSNGGYRLDLRIEIDGDPASMCVSGDTYKIEGQTDLYDNSFVIDAPTISATTTSKKLSGRGRFALHIELDRIEIDLAFAAGTSAANATLSFVDEKGKAYAIYRCEFVSRLFRQIFVEHDRINGVTQFESADISVNQVPAARHGAMGIERAFAEAGIELTLTGNASIVAPGGAGADAKWSDAELHAAMVANNSIRSDIPAWRVYLLSATEHELTKSGDRLRGVMFDLDKRQGCATFHDVIGSGASSDAEIQRRMLRTYVHEIAHCLNLLHAFEPSPVIPARPAALSWMNLPQSYPPGGPEGTKAYWDAFDFSFDKAELRHLRHGLLTDTIPGGSRFFGDMAPDAVVPPAVPFADRTGLAFKIRSVERVKLGAPVIVEFKVERAGNGTTTIDSLLHPRFGRTRIYIRTPDGTYTRFRPLASHCAEGDVLAVAPPVHDSAYIGYGRGGFHFDWPGRYTIKATHLCSDGSILVSNAVTLTVEAPLDAYDAAACELFLSDEAGHLLALLGSDSPSLGNGREAMRLAVDRFPEHRLTDYARLVLGVNSARSFKRVTRINGEAKLEVRKVEPGSAIAALEPLVGKALDSAPRRQPLDAISLAMVAGRLGKVLRDEGHYDRARAIATGLTAHFERHGIGAAARDRIARDIAGRRRRPPPETPDQFRKGEAR